MTIKMQPKTLKLLFGLLVFLAVTGLFIAPVSAVDNVIETTFFGNLKDDGEGCGVYTVLNLVIDTFSIGVGILAVIGITVVGVQYLTAKGNVDQTEKAKHRMFQIVIGLVVYALLYAGVQWLLPGGKLNTNQQCATISDQELAALKAQEAAEKAAKSETSTPTDNVNDNGVDENGTTANGKKILEAAKKVAEKIKGFSYSWGGANFQNKNEVYKTKTVNCASYASLVMAEAGLLAMKTGRVASDNYGEFTILSLGKYKKYWELIKNPHGTNTKRNSNSKTVASLVESGKLVPGDICGSAQYHDHTFIYAGKKGNKYQFYEVSSTGKQTYDNIINNYHSGSYKVGQCLHAK